MTRSELIQRLSQACPSLSPETVTTAVKLLLARMTQSLALGQRIEIRGFGSFSVHTRPPHLSRNPKTGQAVAVPTTHVPHFKPGKGLRERVMAQYAPTRQGRTAGATTKAGATRARATGQPKR
jgi:integration host factor subunit beta